MSRLGLGLGITKGGLIPFNPLSLDPYLFFDSRSSMIGTLENPTLDLDPANPETLDVITATRTGVATYTDADGLIQSASADTVRVDYTQGAELTPTVFQLVPHTDFSTAHWAHLNGTVVTTDTTLSPDGATAKKFSAGNGVSSSSVRSIISTPTTSNTYTLSWYAKAGGFDESMVRIDAGGSTIKGSVNLLTGAVTLQTGSALDSISSEAVSGGWFRISMTMSLSGAGGSIMSRFYPTYSNGYIGDGSSGVYLAQPQLEEGTTASDFVENTTGSPKFITGATYGPRVPMILVEPSSENLITRTDFSGGWSLSSGATVEQTTESTPMASQTALRLTSTQISSRYQAPSAYSSGSSTASVYIKWDGVDTRFRINRGLSNSDVLCNVTQGGVTHHSNTSDGYSIEEHGDGWWRVSNTMTNPTWVQLYADAEDGDGSILVALPQHEAGSIPTSFIPTSGGNAAARTRAADDLQIERDSTNLVENTDFSGWVQSSSTTLTDGAGYVGEPSKIFTASGGTNRVFRSNTFSTASGTSYTGSFWIRRVAGTGTINMVHQYSAQGNLTNISSQISEEWTRVEASFTGHASSGDVYFGVWVASQGDSVEIAMPQVEIGSEATSYIPTSGAAASRTTFSDFYNASEGTVYAEYEPRVISNFNTLFSFQDNNLNNSNFIRSLSSTAYNLWVYNGGAEQAQFAISGGTANSLNRFAGSYKASDYKASLNGVDGTSSLNGTVPSLTKLLIGSQPFYQGRHLNGHIKRLIYWPYHSDSL